MLACYIIGGQILASTYNSKCDLQMYTFIFYSFIDQLMHSIHFQQNYCFFFQIMINRRPAILRMLNVYHHFLYGIDTALCLVHGDHIT